MCSPRPGTSPQNCFQTTLDQKKIPQLPRMKAHHRTRPGLTQVRLSAFVTPLLVYFATIMPVIRTSRGLRGNGGNAGFSVKLNVSQDSSGSSEIFQKQDPVGSQSPKSPPVDTQSNKRGLLGAIEGAVTTEPAHSVVGRKVYLENSN